MKRIFPILLIGTLVAGGAVLFAIWRANPATSQDFLQSGKQYYQEKKFSEAEIQLLNAVRKDARNREARYLLAMTYLNKQDLNSAAKQLVSLMEYYPDDAEANLQLGNIYLQAGAVDAKYFRDAEEIAKKLLAKDPNNVAALILAGNAAGGQRDYVSSLDSYQKAVSLDPQNAPAFVSIGTTQTLRKQLPEAEKAFLKAREIDPKNRSALVSLANYYRVTGDVAKSESAFKEALAAYPQDVGIYTQLVQLYYQNDRFDDGVRLLQEQQAKDPKNPAPSIILGDMYLAKNRTEDARRVMTDLKKTFPENREVAVRLAVFFMGTDINLARQEVAAILKADPNSPAGNLLQGELYYLDGRFEEALATFSKPQVADSAMAEAQFFLGNLANRKQEIDKAQTYFEKAVRMNPRYVAARVALAEVLLRKGKSAEARRELQNALELQGDFVPARLLMAGLDRSEKRFPEAESALNSLLKEQPRNPLLHRQMAAFHFDRGNTGDAEKSLNKALEFDPDSMETLRNLIQVDIKTKQFDKAAQRINSLPENKKTAIHYELLGAVYTQAGKLKESETAFKKALEKDPKRSAGDALLAAQYLGSGRLDEGLGKLDDLVKKEPLNVGALGTKGIIYEQQGKPEEAKAAYEAALKVNPEANGVANNLAYLFAEEPGGKNLEKALSLAQAARKAQPESPEIADTLGWVYYKLGNHILAKDQLSFAISKQGNNPTMHYHLGMVYKALKQNKDAETSLKKAVSLPGEFKEKALAQAALKEVTSAR
jgi:cellulose synthase operon protein C